MAVNEFEITDFIEVARSRITQQFFDKPLIDRTLQLLLFAQFELQNVLKDLMQLRSIDTATGEQLNVIGRIVGQDRVLLSSDLYEFFGFQGALKAGSYGTLEDETVGSIWWSLGTPLGGNIVLTDEVYRLFIRAKILKNTTNTTSEEFIQSLNLLFGDSAVLAIEEDEAEPSGNVLVLFNRELTDFELGLLNYTDNSSGYSSGLIPKTVGVNIKYGRYVRTDNPISWSFVYNGETNFDGSKTFNATPTYSEEFDKDDLEIILY